jgi:hypothetical protein
LADLDISVRFRPAEIRAVEATEHVESSAQSGSLHQRRRYWYYGHGGCYYRSHEANDFQLRDTHQHENDNRLPSREATRQIQGDQGFDDVGERDRDRASRLRNLQGT